MPRKVDEPITRLHINLFSSDLEWLQEKYGKDSTGVGVGAAIRFILRNNIKRAQELMDSKKRPIAPLSEDDIEEAVEEMLKEETDV